MQRLEPPTQLPRCVENRRISCASVVHTSLPAQATAQAIRGTSDWKNGAIGGLAAGAAIGLRGVQGWPRVHAHDAYCHTVNAGFKPSVAIGATLAITSALVDLTDGHMRGMFLYFYIDSSCIQHSQSTTTLVMV